MRTSNSKAKTTISATLFAATERRLNGSGASSAACTSGLAPEIVENLKAALEQFRGVGNWREMWNRKTRFEPKVARVMTG